MIYLQKLKHFDMRVVAFANRKGGAGKSTSAVNSGACLSLSGKRVLLIDSDPQGGATVALGLNRWTLDKSYYDSIILGKPLKENVYPTGVQGLDILPANDKLDAADLELSKVDQPALVLKELLEKLEGYDFVLVDCPPNLGLLTLNALLAAEIVIVPLLAEYHSLEGTEDLRRFMENAETYFNHKPIRRFLVTKFTRSDNHGKQVIEVLKTQFKGEVCNTIIPKSVRVTEAPSFGKPVVTYAPNSPASKAYWSFVEELNG
jgi:chromosome partitioning protein